MNGDVSESATAKPARRRSRSPASWCGSLLPPARDRSGSGWPSAGPRSRWAWPSSCSTRTGASRFLQPSPRLVLLGAAAGGVMAAATYLLYPVLARLAPFIATDTARLYAAFRAPPPVIASLALAPVILGEELVWRGVVQACARAAPRAVERRHAGGGRVCARARASRLTRPRGGGAAVRDRLGHAARRQRESRTGSGGSPGVGRPGVALAAAGLKMTEEGATELHAPC